MVLLPDTGRNYITKLYSDAWMRENNFWEDTHTPDVPVGSLLAQKDHLPSLISVDPRDKLSDAISLIAAHQISQIPVVENGTVIGSLNESSVMKALHDGLQPEVQEIRGVMGAPRPALDEAADLSEAYRLLFTGAPAIVITRNHQPYGVITRFDVISQLSKKAVRG